jgi:hypothetical protein
MPIAIEVVYLRASITNVQKLRGVNLRRKLRGVKVLI